MIRIFCAILFFVIAAQSQIVEISSPKNVIQLKFNLENGKPVYQVFRFGVPVIENSKLGFILKDAPPLVSDFKIIDEKITRIDETWEQPWGEKRYIHNFCNEAKIILKENKKHSRTLSIIFRLFDDGVAFRYEIPKQDHLGKFEIMNELTEFNFSTNHKAWWIPAYEWNRYEYLYQESVLNDIKVVHTPFTLSTNDGLFISIHEAALTDFASMTLLRKKDNSLEADLVPWSDGVKVKTRTPMKSPWRLITIADNPGDLITSDIALNLNEPAKLDDVSWIKPGKYVGIWWEMHLAKSTWGSGEKHGATTQNAKRYIDFAARYGFDGVLVEGWNIGWDGDWIANSDQYQFTKAYPDFDIKAVADYALSKNVRLIGHHETATGIENYEHQMDDAYKLYEKLGVRAVKTGYVGHGKNIKRTDENNQIQKEWHHGQYMVRHYRKAVQQAAKHKLMIVAHEPIKATGIRRTWPNMMTREGARGQEFNAWGPNNGNPPEHTLILPFTRLLAGPMDFTPGIFDLLYEEARPDNRVNTTITKQLALYVLIYSPLHMAADYPENYEAKQDLFKFIVDVPTDWSETKVLHASIGNYLTIVRKDRNSKDWYLGSATDENGRILKTHLSFLEPGKKYRAEIYRDGANADWQSNPYDYKIEKKIVDRNSELEIRLAPGGGQAIRFHALQN